MESMFNILEPTLFDILMKELYGILKSKYKTFVFLDY